MLLAQAPQEMESADEPSGLRRISLWLQNSVKIDCDPIGQVSCCRFDGHPVKLIPVALELNRAEIADGRVPASEEKKLSIAALPQTLPDRLILQTTPWSAIKRSSNAGPRSRASAALPSQSPPTPSWLDDRNVEDWS